MVAIFTSVPTSRAPGRIKREQFVNFKALMENKDLVQTNMLFSLKLRKKKKSALLFQNPSEIMS